MLLEINFNLALFLVRLYRVTSVSGAKNGRCRLERWLKFVIQQTTFFENFKRLVPFAFFNFFFQLVQTCNS
jgi:hypothetical protein